MTIPLATTTVTASTATETEPGEGRTVAVLASGVRAVIAAPSGAEVAGPGGGSERLDAVLVADPIEDLTHKDLIVDAEGNEFEVRWVAQRVGFGINHTRAGLTRLTGRPVG
jgi:hypothetical protein